MKYTSDPKQINNHVDRMFKEYGETTASELFAMDMNDIGESISRFGASIMKILGSVDFDPIINTVTFKPAKNTIPIELGTVNKRTPYIKS